MGCVRGSVWKACDLLAGIRTPHGVTRSLHLSAKRAPGQGLAGGAWARRIGTIAEPQAAADPRSTGLDAGRCRSQPTRSVRTSDQMPRTVKDRRHGHESVPGAGCQQPSDKLCEMESHRSPVLLRMVLRPCRLLVLALALAGLTGCGLPSALSPSQPSSLAELGVRVPAPDALPPLQAAALADGAVTREEYAQAFAAFARCAEDRGDTVDVMGIDPSTGLIRYGTSQLLGVPGEPAGGPQGACFEETFSWIELVFQVSDPAVLDKGYAEQDELYAEEGAPCLARNGINAPSEVDTRTPEGLDWFGRYTALASRQEC